MQTTLQVYIKYIKASMIEYIYQYIVKLEIL